MANLLFTICDVERCFWLRKLVCEIETKDGTFYPPNSLYQISVGMQWYLRENENADMDIFSRRKFMASQARQKWVEFQNHLLRNRNRYVRLGITVRELEIN